jgi:hypothetical protein
MRYRLWPAFAVLVLLSLSGFADSKIKTRNSAMGHSSEGTVYIKGARERVESAGMGPGGPAMVTVTQCDQKRIITINPQANTCLVMPLGGDSGKEAPAAPAAAAGPSRKGGTITFSVNTVDTGERQKMFGLSARHIKSTTSAESSPDACSKNSFRSESDGWYADIAPSFSCSMGGMAAPPRRGGPSGCQDTVRFKRTGGGHPGYPLKQTTTMQAEGHSFTMTSEVVELTTTPLDASLFDMPAGCRVVSSYEELIDLAGMMAGATGRRPPTPPARTPAPAATPAPEPPRAAPTPAPAPAPAVAPKTGGVVRVGVVKVADHTGQYLPVFNLRLNLMSEVTHRQMEAVPLEAEGEAAIAAEALGKACDYILYTDATQVKNPGAGGLTLPVTLRGVALRPDKYQALIGMTLYRVGRPLPELKQVPLAADGDDMYVNAVMAAFEKEADKVAEQIKKDRSPARPASKTPPARKPAISKKPG